jgi:peptidoglycan L-alanyl-D-glutamate endopeptidase CwlK
MLLQPNDEEKLAHLYPPFADVVRAFVLEAQARKMAVGIFCGLRTYEEQSLLYEKGRSSPGPIVTRARAGRSFHDVSLAVDLVFDGQPTVPGYQWSWDDKYPWRDLALLGQKFGLEAAYFWRSFPESPHFQMSYGFKIQELDTIFRSGGGLSAVWKALDERRACKSTA